MITAVYVDPDQWQRGHGRALATAAESAAGREGFEQLVLWVLHTNDAAFAFYATLGFAPDGAERTDSQLGVELRVVRYRLRLGA